MSIKKICEKSVVTTAHDSSIHEVAKLMKKYHVGAVVVIDETKNNVPMGVITDRDIVIKIATEEVELCEVTAGDAMSEDLLILKENQGVYETIKAMSGKGVRRAPVVDDNNKIVGIVSVDDFILLLSEELANLAKLLHKQIFSVKT